MRDYRDYIVQLSESITPELHKEIRIIDLALGDIEGIKHLRHNFVTDLKTAFEMVRCVRMGNKYKPRTIPKSWEMVSK